MTKEGPRDIDKGLRLDLPVVHYTSNRETKDFIEREAAKLEPNFRRKPGTRYLLNRWREEQLSSGRRITYGDLVRQAIELNKTKKGPLRVEHGRERSAECSVLALDAVIALFFCFLFEATFTFECEDVVLQPYLDVLRIHSRQFGFDGDFVSNRNLADLIWKTAIA